MTPSSLPANRSPPAFWQSPCRIWACMPDRGRAGRVAKISFEEMLEMASLGAKVLQVRSVELAMVHRVRTFVRSSFDDADAPGMGDLLNPPGTLICDEEEIVEQQVVTGIAYAKD